MVGNLSVDARTREDHKLCKIRPWLERTSMKVSPEEFNSADEIMVVPFKGWSKLRHHFPNKPQK